MHRQFRQTAALIIASAAFACAGVSPRQDYSSDCSQAPVKRALTFVQAGSQLLGWTFTQGATAKDLTTATSVLFTFVPADRSWSQAITGAVEVATNGSVLVTMTPTQMNTNTAASGPFDWLLTVASPSETLAYAYGKLTVVADPSQSITNTFTPASPNASQAWVTGLGYGTGDVSKVYVDSLIPAQSVTSSNDTSSVALKCKRFSGVMDQDIVASIPLTGIAGSNIVSWTVQVLGDNVQWVQPNDSITGFKYSAVITISQSYPTPLVPPVMSVSGQLDGAYLEGKEVVVLIWYYE